MILILTIDFLSIIIKQKRVSFQHKGEAMEGKGALLYQIGTS